MITRLPEIHLHLTLCLVTLIWLVQLVHYPMFGFLEGKSFRAAMKFHQRRISFIVMPLMLGEIGVSGILAWFAPTAMNLLAFACVLGIWACTFFIIVPIHEKLSGSQDRPLIEKLVLQNWVRTILWSTKAILLLA